MSTNTESKIMSRTVWSKNIRLAHWVLALSTLAMMITGWLIANTPSVAQIASDYHHLIAALFAVSLGFRFLLLFIQRSGAGYWKNMIKAWPEFSHIKKMGQFYLTFGRSELPQWFSHNFAWIPLYFTLFLILSAQVVVGIFMIYDIYAFNLYPPEIHRLLAAVVFWFVAFHLYAVVLHDLKNKNADISAMINGYRYFEVNLTRSSEVKSSFTIDVTQIK